MLAARILHISEPTRKAEIYGLGDTGMSQWTPMLPYLILSWNGCEAMTSESDVKKYSCDVIVKAHKSGA